MKRQKMLKMFIIGFFLLSILAAQSNQENLNEHRFWKNAKRLLCGSASLAPSKVSSFTKSHLTFEKISSPQDVTKIELFNSITTILMKIEQRYSDSILCMLNKGHQGSYKGRITYKNGYSIETNNELSIHAKINSIYPKKGNYQGGVLLTIQGEGFGYQDSLSEVLIGEAQCEIFSYSENEIQCITQPAWKLLNQKRNVVLKRKNTISFTENIANTEFTFINVENQPSISKIYSNSGQYNRGSVIYVEGTNLYFDGLQTQLLIGTQSISFQKTEAGLSFVIPETSTNQVQNLIIFVDQNGSTQLQQFQVSNKLYCLNPDNSMYLLDEKTMLLAAQNNGVQSEYPKVEIMFDSQPFAITYTEIISQAYFYKHILVPQIPAQITSINIDNQNILTSPIKLIKSILSFNPRFNLTTHPSDSNYFQIQLIQDGQTSGLVVQNFLILIPSIGFVDELILEGNNTFKYPKLKQQFYSVYFYLCTNQGSTNYFPVDTSDLYEIEEIKLLTNNKYPKSGDIIQFQIPVIKKQNYNYQMKVTCPNGYYYQDFYGKLIYQYDSFFAAPFQQSGIVYSFRFPTIVQRLKGYKDSCDLSIVTIHSNALYGQILDNNVYLESSDFLSNFLQEPNVNSTWIKQGIGFLSKKYELLVFQDAVYPQRQRIYVSNIQPRVLSAYGREQIFIYGNNFLSNNNTINTTSVNILGVDCQVQSVTNTQIICLSGIKKSYDPLDISTVSIGNEQALMLDHVQYSLDLNEQQFYKLNYQLTNQLNLSIPYNMAATLDVGKFLGDNITFDNINIDGKLILNCSRDLNITIQQIKGQKFGILSLGTVEKRINTNCNITINNQIDVHLYAYGKNVGNYNYNLVKNIFAQSNLIEVQESKVHLKKGNKIMILATSLDEKNEELVVEEVKFNKIKVSTPIASNHQNTNQNTKLQNGNSFQYAIQVPIIQTDRNLLIKGPNLQFDELYDARVESLSNQDVSLKNAVNAYILVGTSYQGYSNVTSSVLQFTQLSNSNIYAAQFLNNFIVVPNNNSSISLVVGKFNYNFIQSGIVFDNIKYRNSQNNIGQTEFLNNVLVASQTCIIIKYPLSIKMSQNTCFSFQYFTNFLYTHSIQSEDLAFAALDIRQALVQYQYILDQYYEINIYAIQPQVQNRTKFLVVANSRQNKVQYYPALFVSDYPKYNYTLSNFYDFEVLGFNQNNLTIQYQNPKKEASQNFISVIDFFNFRSDIPKNTVLFNDTLSDPTKGLVLIDRDGSLTGKVQSILSSNLASPSLSCSLNDQKLNSCSSLVGVMTVQYVNVLISQQCYLQQSNSFAVIYNGQQYLPNVTQINNALVTPLNQTATFKFVQKYTGEEIIPCNFVIEPRYLTSGDLGFIVKYSVDTSKLQKIQIYLKDNQYQVEQQVAQNKLDVSSCNHGQYYIETDGIQFCVKILDGFLQRYLVVLQVKQ
ncbi:hypothetical protein ABPG74_005381 [Tetrahymena malaccensis]